MSNLSDKGSEVRFWTQVTSLEEQVNGFFVLHTNHKDQDTYLRQKRIGKFGSIQFFHVIQVALGL